MKRILTLLVAAILAVWTPVAQTVTKTYKITKEEVTTLVATYLPWLIPLGIGSQDAPADPGLPPGEVFINGLIVLGSGIGLVQTGSSSRYMGGLAYDNNNYLRITLDAPSNPRFVRGWAIDGNGAVHVYDASAGLPANIHWQDGLPVTSTGQLCVAFI